MNEFFKSMTALMLMAAVPSLAAASNGRCKLQGEGVERCLMLRMPAGLLSTIAEQHQLTVVDALSPAEPDAVLVEVPSSTSRETVLENLLQEPDVVDAEAVSIASLSESDAAATLDLAGLGSLDSISVEGRYDGDEAALFAGDVWNGYLQQPAVAQMRLDVVRSLQLPESYGSGVVAVIDTGVDPTHPLLQGSLVPGYDFILDQPGIPSEWDMLEPAGREQTREDLETIADQSYAGILEGLADSAVASDSTRVIADQSYAGILEQSYAGILEQSYAGILEDATFPETFGHGTMVAGLVRLVAPGALIMPIRVFGGDGTASTSDIVEAIHFAIDNGADVINMSFSMDESSRELNRAILRAWLSGVVCVSSAGNQSSPYATYPAGHLGVIGVASTDAEDRLSDFSSYGADFVLVGAPGEGVVSLYPGGLYAGGWGTSFASALVSGVVSLMHDIDGEDLDTVRLVRAKLALSLSAETPDPSVPLGALGAGRVDALGAFVLGLASD